MLILEESVMLSTLVLKLSLRLVVFSKTTNIGIPNLVL